MHKFFIIILLIFILSPIVNSQGNSSPQITPYPESTYFHSDPNPAEIDIDINPLDYASQRLDIDFRNFNLPRGHERNYRFACRFPIIDYVSNQPLYMKQWAEETANQLDQTHQKNGLEAVNFAVDLLVGTRVEVPKIQDSIHINPMDEKLKSSNFTPEYQKILLELYRAYAQAVLMCDSGRESLGQDMEFFMENPGYYIAPDGETMPSLTGNVDSQFQFIEKARKVNFEPMFSANKHLATAIQTYIKATKNLTSQDIFVDPTKSDENFVIESDNGTIIIAGTGKDTHEKNAPFIIDFGGDDVFGNNAGGGGDDRYPVALCIDHAGNDTYSAKRQRYVQGFGFLGCGFLIDLAGDDRYHGEHFVQGGGILGVGTLYDLAGYDEYDAEGFCQGAGMFGLGILLDSADEDLYDCATLGQGAATTLGMGVLSDLQGDDRYYLAIDKTKDALGRMPGYGQGGALSFRHLPWERRFTAYGGVGILSDKSGNDRYKSQGWCDQGGSYIMSLGMLHDGDGNDHYTCHCGQGSGIHITNAILIDHGGHDIYEGEFRAGGSGGDKSPGFLLDYSGNDVYRSKTSSYGTGVKPFSYSLFVDYSGDDTYICPEPKGDIEFNNWDSFGGVWPESEPYLWPYALAFDLNGVDDYQVRHRANNTERHSFGHGLHLDMEWQNGDIIGEIKNPLPEYTEFELPEKVQTSKYYKLIKDLQNPHLFVRFSAIGKIADSDPEIIEFLAASIQESGHRQFNRDVMEAIHYFFVNENISQEQISHLENLLTATDEEVRFLMADNFGMWEIKQTEDALIAALKKDESGTVRRFVLRSLYRLNSDKALPIVKEIALSDDNMHVRRISAYFLAKMDSANVFDLLVEMIEQDESSSVKMAAIEALDDLHDERAIPILRDAAQSGNFYIQRAAGRGLAELYQPEGIGILIESLTFPSIDAFYNYNNNVPNDIATYSGSDLPEADRYDQEKWRTWFAENKDNIDIKINVESARAFDELVRTIRDSSDEIQIKRMEEFLVEYPNMEKAKKTLSRKLNALAWNMVTADRTSEEFDAETGLRYAKRAVELDRHPNYVDTLAEAYFALGNIEEAEKICKEMLEEHPGEKMFLERLERCRAVKSKRDNDKEN